MTDPISFALEASTYAADIPAKDWKEALCLTAKLLEGAGAVTPSYVQKIIEDSAPLGFYYVVGPHIAMPHARPEFGAIRPGLAVTTSRKGIVFASHEFNPVHVIFMISVLENDGHIDFIMKMAEILQDRPFIEALTQCTNNDEIRSLLLQKQAK